MQKNFTVATTAAILPYGVWFKTNVFRALTLVGPPRDNPELDPLAVQLLNNQL